MRKEVQPGGGTTKKDGHLGRDGSTAHRLYELLDTLVAMRMDLDARGDGMPGTFKIEETRAMLDAAIASTKEIIVDLVRPRL